LFAKTADYKYLGSVDFFQLSPPFFDKGELGEVGGFEKATKTS